MRDSKLTRRPVNSTKTKSFQLKGGINEITAPLSLDPGELYGVSNYEPGEINGYRRISGYERLDGQNSPSEASYWLVNFDAGTTAISEGDEVANVAGSPTSSDMVGEVLTDAIVETGSYVGNDAAGYFYVTRVSNRVDPDFSDNDTLYVSAASVAIADGISLENGAITDADDTALNQDAIETLRARILAVPGSGIIRGVWPFNGDNYAFRDNVGGTACVMYKTSATGFTAVDLGATIPFTAGNDVADIGFTLGETITGGTSGATAEVVDFVKTSGSWSAGTAVGVLYLTNVTSGSFQAETGTGGTSGTTASIVAETVTALLPGGRYEFINENFYGATSRKGMYGVDGVNLGFVLTINGFRQIPTGMVVDAPTHLEEFQKHLFYSFPGGSAQHSPTGDPGNVWTPILGASEIGTGDEIVGFVQLPSNSFGILNRNRTYVLSGTTIDDWDLDIYSDESGAIEWTIQRMKNPIYFDDRGLIDFSAVDTYGNFENASFSERVKKTLKLNKKNVLSSIRVKDKNQYRIFFNNNTFVIASFEDKKQSGFTVCEYPVPVECTASAEDANGNEILLFGSDDGYVYQMDKGTSFDGSEVDAFIRLAFNFINQAEYNKDFLKAVFEIDSGEAISVSFTPDFDYGESDDITQALNVQSPGGTWDVSNWDQFVWGDQLISTPVAYIDGQGQNIGITLFTSHTYEPVHTFNSVILHYINLGIKRD